MGCNFSQLIEEVTSASATTAADDQKVNGNQQQQQQQQHQQHQQQQQQQQQHHSVLASATEISTVYASLPSGAEKHQVQHVYDGDTLTLSDQNRVRFLGIDTPELKEKQPFAQEAKEFTQNLCTKGGDVWLSFEGDRQDHYGRLLAFVWVKSSSGYVCVNEAIVGAGLATVYLPNASSKLFNKDKLMALQKQARLHKRGMWSNFQDARVFKTANGTAYHVRSCSYLENTHNLTELRASEAADLGLHPCRKCMA